MPKLISSFYMYWDYQFEGNHWVETLFRALDANEPSSSASNGVIIHFTIPLNIAKINGHKNLRPPNSDKSKLNSYVKSANRVDNPPVVHL